MKSLYSTFTCRFHFKNGFQQVKDFMTQKQLFGIHFVITQTYGNFWLYLLLSDKNSSSNSSTYIKLKVNLSLMYKVEGKFKLMQAWDSWC